MLQTIEALRAYAAEHGRLPETLADVTDTPVLDDPIFGRPFDYTLDGDTAVLRAEGMGNLLRGVEYTIRLREPE
ncbi:MAG: hypothetical protein ACFCVE_01745 [Phycisphaerae bacterium]